MELKKEEIIESKYLYEGKILKLRHDVVKLQNGNTSTREIVEHSGGVCVIAIDENKNVLMVKQYRRPFDDILLEIPAGKINLGEDPYTCGVRELEEETGYTTDQMTSLGKMYVSPGFCTEVIHIYMTDRLIKGTLNPDEDEFLQVERIPFNRLLNMVMSDEVKDSKTIIAILKANQILNGQ